MAKRIEVIADGVSVQTSRLWNTNSTVVTGIGIDAKSTLVADPGWYPNEIADLQAASAATPPGHATHVLFTHGDFDHVVGWEDFPDANIIAHREVTKRDPDEIERRVADLDRRNRSVRPRPYRYPSLAELGVSNCSPAQNPPIVLGAGDLDHGLPGLDLGGGTALFFPAPGHTADGLFTVLPRRHVLIAGDYLSDEEFPFIYHSLTDYRSTLLLARELCHRYGIVKEVPGHGQVATTPVEIEYRISTDLDYLERLESAVTEAKSKGWDVEAAVTDLSKFTFRGKPIVGSQVAAHTDNIRLLYGQDFRKWEP